MIADVAEGETIVASSAVTNERRRIRLPENKGDWTTTLTAPDLTLFQSIAAETQDFVSVTARKGRRKGNRYVRLTADFYVRGCEQGTGQSAMVRRGVQTR